MKRFWQWLRRGLAFVFLTLVFLLGAIALMLNTESGSRFVLHRIAAAVPGALEFDGMQGTLWRTLRIGSFSYRTESLELSASVMLIEISWPNVFAGRIVADRVDVGQIIYRKLTPGNPGPSPLEISMSPLPVAINVGRSNVGSFSFLSDTTDFQMERISLGNASIDGSRIEADLASVTFYGTEFSLQSAKTDLSGDVPASAQIGWKQLDSDWSGSGTVSGTLAEARVSHTLRAPFPASTEGVVRLLNRIEPEFDLDVRWQLWNIAGAVLRDGDVAIRGTTNNYDTELQVSLSEPRIPDVLLSGSASGNTEGLSNADLRLESAQGNVAVEGSLSWLPTLTADLATEIDNFDLAVVTDRITGLVSGSARFVMAGPGEWSVTNTSLNGIVNDAAMVASGDLTMAPEQLRCGRCRLALGANRVAADGTFGDDQIALNIQIEAPSLNAAWPDIDGSLTVDGRLDGTLQAPRFAGTANGSNLRYDAWSIDSLRANSRGSGTDRVDLTMSVSDLRQGESLFGSVEGVVNGTPDQVDVDVTWTYAELTVAAAGSVLRTDAGFAGTVARAALNEPYLGRWVLAAPISVRQDNLALNVGAHRWVLPGGLLDVTRFHSSANELALTASLSGLPLATANNFLPEFFRLDGTAGAEIDIARRDDQWLGSIHWQQADTVLRVARPGEAIYDLKIPQASVDALLVDGGAQIESALRIEPGVSVALNVGLNQLNRDAAINARLRIDGEQWDWVTALVPVIDNFSGDISANLAASGPLLAPELSGEASWLNGSVTVPSLNVPLTDVNLVASGASSGTATLRGSAQAGAGKLDITGRFEDLMVASRRLEFTLKGQTAEVINWPEYQLWASPDMTIVGSADGWTLGGAVEVPKAEIAVRELPENAVGISADVRTADEEIATQYVTRYSGEARVRIGDEVHVSAFGLDTRLTGNLVVRKQVDQELSAEGRVILVDGEFVAYGQRLAIEEGTLTFTGPLDNPIVDVRAVRIIENFGEKITAGIQLRGRAQNLTSSVFSEPTMSEADALSYLIIGRPLAQASDTEGGQLSGAAVGLGLRQASRITQQIGQSLGLDQLAITGDGGDATALVAGKQISNRLYARYAYGVFSRLGMIMIRYRLSERLSLEAGAGENQSIDILYSVEKQ